MEREREKRERKREGSKTWEEKKRKRNRNKRKSLWENNKHKISDIVTVFPWPKCEDSKNISLHVLCK